MGRQGLLAGEVVARSGVSRKALRLYESSGILPPPARTGAGYRVYDAGTLGRLAFVSRARSLGLRLAEIREIVAIRRSGGVPCRHVRALVRRKAAELDRTLAELGAVRRRLRALLAARPRGSRRGAVICPHIEHANRAQTRRTSKWKA